MTLIPELRAELHHAAGNVTASGARLRLLTEGKRRLVSTRTALVGGTVVLAAVVAAVVLVLSTASTKQSAWSRHALQQAAAVIIPKGSSNTILHISAVETFSPAEQRLRRHASEPVISKLTEQLWTREGDRGQERVILHVPGGPVLESDYTNTIYDRTNNTVYPPPQFPRSNPRYTLTPAADGGARLNVNLPGGGTYTQTLKAGVARKLRNGTDVVRWGILYFDPHTGTNKVIPTVEPASALPPQTPQPDPASAGFDAQLHTLLSSTQARARRTTLNGRPAIEISTVGIKTQAPIVYYVHPRSYTPIELDELGYGKSTYDTRVTFTTYRTLPVAGNQRLLRLSIPKSAHVDHSPAGRANVDGLPRPF
jgi:hypothetical protein